MNLIIQVLLINLVISCENAGIFALATNGLPPHLAQKAHRIGIGLSLIFKLLFIAIAGILFAIPWLHIRIAGGVLLLCITFNMLLHNGQTSDNKITSGTGKKDSLFEAIISISVAVISMSFDDAIAILGIISTDGNIFDFQKVAVAITGLFFGALVLLLFSDTVTKLIGQYPCLNDLCAGYLAYMAIKMIFEDDTIKLFFGSINFTFAIPGAALCGILTAFYGMLSSHILSGVDIQKRNTNLPIYCIIVIYALAKTGAISYLGTNPIVEGYQLNVQTIYGFIPSGANAVYTIASSAELITICAAVLAGSNARNNGKKTYLSLLFSNAAGTLIYVLLGLYVNTVGLSFMYGFGQICLLNYSVTLAAQVLLLLSYTAVFTMISTLIKGKSMIIMLGLLFVMLEPIEAAVFIYSERFPAVAFFFPSYHLAAIAGYIASPYSIPMTMLISILYIVFFTYIGYCHFQSRYAVSK